jgi:hypothetical protein
MPVSICQLITMFHAVTGERVGTIVLTGTAVDVFGQIVVI